MEEFWRQISSDVPSAADVLTNLTRLLVAAVCGAIPGIERETKGMAAGLRTHVLVSLGSAMFVLAALGSGASVNDVTRVVQGIATGIGFVGGGAILKSKENLQISGLTTSASIWLTAALGTAAALGRIWLPLMGAVLALIVLALLRRLEFSDGPRATQPGDEQA